MQVAVGSVDGSGEAKIMKFGPRECKFGLELSIYLQQWQEQRCRWMAVAEKSKTRFLHLIKYCLEIAFLVWREKWYASENALVTSDEFFCRTQSYNLFKHKFYFILILSDLIGCSKFQPIKMLKKQDIIKFTLKILVLNHSTNFFVILLTFIPSGRHIGQHNSSKMSLHLTVISRVRSSLINNVNNILICATMFF